jgi:23S rRNA (uridine2552-2'-O)-methyltransferase
MTTKGGRGSRDLKVRLKSGKRRTPAARRWLTRQLNDPYVARARQEGLRSRAAFKLAEIDDKFRLLRPGAAVVDLGAAPGGWSQVAAARTGAANPSGQAGGRVVAIDLLDMPPIPGVDFLQLDFLDAAAPDKLREQLGRPADMGLAEAAAMFAREVLRPGGTFLCKVLQGGTENALLADLKRDFAAVRHVKPAASRPDSAELYVLATGFRGSGEH